MACRVVEVALGSNKWQEVAFSGFLTFFVSVHSSKPGLGRVNDAKKSRAA